MDLSTPVTLLDTLEVQDIQVQPVLQLDILAVEDIGDQLDILDQQVL